MNQHTSIFRERGSQIDLQRKVLWIHPDQSKSGKPITVPLSQGAVDVLVSQQGKHPVRVFTRKGKPVAKAGAVAWRKALDRCKIRKYVEKDKSIKNSPYPHFKDDEYLFEDFCWHNLRHTWASWHVMSGTPLHVLQQLGGWSSYEMVLRYAHLSADHLAEYADNIQGRDSAINDFVNTGGAKVVAINSANKKAANG